MGLDTELEFEKYCKAVRSPKISRPCSEEAKKRYEKGKLTIRSYVLKNLNDEFTELSFGRSRSSSYESMAYGPTGVSGDEAFKRDSMYQSSKEIRKMKKIGAIEGRRKLELARSSDSLLSFRILDSLPRLEGVSPFVDQKRPSLMSLNGPPNDGKGLPERNTLLTLHKSSSEKVGMPYLSRRQESDRSKAGLKSRYSPFRRILNPVMKSKSQRNPSVSVAELGDVPTVGLENSRRNRTLHKLLSTEFLTTESRAGFVKKDHHNSVVPSSPAHLHGLLKLELKHGLPFFEFSLKDSADVHSAKSWRTDKPFNWIYTFHAINSQRTSNSNGWVIKERQKESSMVGQMQVSCFFVSGMRNDDSFVNSMMTEFVLYDIMHARRKSTQEGICCSSDSVRPAKGTSGESLVVESNDIVSDMVSRKLQTRCASDNDGLDASTHYPWAPADLHPNLELAAIVIQVPFEKRESLQYRSGDKLGGKEQLRLFDFASVDGITSGASCAKVKVVTPSGTHGLPTTKEVGGPSALLDRWRSGGCCDCGGWDMACPLIVCESPSAQNMADHSLMAKKPPLELFFQGTKEKMPALSITCIDEGQYSVDFHAKLSKLQAFAISIAMLHNTEGFTAIGLKKSKKRLQCNSLKVLLDKEMSFLIEAVEEK